MKFLLKTCCFALVIWFALCVFFPDVAWGANSNYRSEIPRAVEQSTASAYCTPEQVAIGEPFTLFLDIVHDTKLRVLLDAPDGGGKADQFGDSWVVIEPRRVVHLPLNDGTGRTLTQVRWRMFGLEPGELALPVIGADALTSGAVQRIDSGMASIHVQPELAEGEDLARPMVGFLPAPDVQESPLGTIALVLFSTLFLFFAILCGLLLRWFLKRKRSPGIATGPTPMAQLALLDPSDEAGVRDLHYSLAQLTRRALDGPGHELRVGKTDEEWIESLRAAKRLPEPIVERTQVLLLKCAEVKYGASTPTRWAATEAWEEAQAICKEAETAQDAQAQAAQNPKQPAEAQA